MQRLVGGSSSMDKSAVTSRGPDDRLLVAVHGICKHPHGFSNPWWDALKPFTTVFGAGTLDVTRLEVLWSDIVNQRGLRTIGDATAADRAEFAAHVRGVLEDRTATEGFERDTTSASARDLITRDLSAMPRPEYPRHQLHRRFHGLYVR